MTYSENGQSMVKGSLSTDRSNIHLIKNLSNGIGKRNNFTNQENSFENLKKVILSLFLKKSANLDKTWRCAGEDRE